MLEEASELLGGWSQLQGSSIFMSTGTGAGTAAYILSLPEGHVADLCIRHLCDYHMAGHPLLQSGSTTPRMMIELVELFFQDHISPVGVYGHLLYASMI